MNNKTPKNKIIELSRLLIQALEVNNIANIIGYQRQLKEAFMQYENSPKYNTKVLSVYQMDQKPAIKQSRTLKLKSQAYHK